MQREVVIESVEPALSRNGSPFWRVRVRGEPLSYFVWDEAVASKLRPGHAALVEVGGGAQYPRITAVYEWDPSMADDGLPPEWDFDEGDEGEAAGEDGGNDLAAAAEAPAVSAAPAVPRLLDPVQREMRMLRMSALRAAADVYAGSAVSSEELLAYAERLIAWLLSDEQLPPLPS
ncbi:MAG: hypothetical protein NZ761_00595 [Dehalococcoidia bacterium]|nr:hypothetical protein [Dehalococcoidia bacterium]